MSEEVVTEEETKEEITEEPDPLEAIVPSEPEEEVAEEEAEEPVEVAEEPVEETEDTVPHGALHAERERRKEAEARAAVLEEQAEAHRRTMAPEEKDEEVVDWEGVGVAPETGKFIEGLITKKSLDDRVVQSRIIGQRFLPDFEEVLEKSGVFAVIEKDRALAEIIANNPSPYLAAYDLGVKILGSPENTEARVEAARKEGADEVIQRVTKPKPKGLTGAKGSGGPETSHRISRAEAAELTQEDWEALPHKTRERLKMGID